MACWAKSSSMRLLTFQKATRLSVPGARAMLTGAKVSGASKSVCSIPPSGNPICVLLAYHLMRTTGPTTCVKPRSKANSNSVAL